MDGMDKHRQPRTHYVTCRMTDDVYQRFKAYCEQYHLSLSDALNDFAICLMAQDFGRKIHEKMAEHVGSRGWKAAHNRIRDEIHTIPVDAPIHCSRPGCGHLLDSEKSNEWVFTDGLIFHDWRCALKHFEQRRMKEWET